MPPWYSFPVWRHYILSSSFPFYRSFFFYFLFWPAQNTKTLRPVKKRKMKKKKNDEDYTIIGFLIFLLTDLIIKTSGRSIRKRIEIHDHIVFNEMSLSFPVHLDRYVPVFVVSGQEEGKDRHLCHIIVYVSWAQKGKRQRAQDLWTQWLWHRKWRELGQYEKDSSWRQELWSPAFLFFGLELSSFSSSSFIILFSFFFVN